MQDQDTLVVILSTLHRLEARFEDQSDRLTVIERSVSPGPEPSLRRSISTRTWSSTRPSVDQMAAEYKTSIAEIRNRFTFVDDSESDGSVNMNHTPADKDGDWQSVSVYSRPQSQLQLELVPPPRNPDRDKHEAPELIAVRYEDMVDSPEPMSSNGTFISNSQFSPASSPAASSTTTPGYPGNVTFSDYLENHSNHSDRSRDSIRASLAQRAANLRNMSHVLLEKAVDNLFAVMDTLPDRMETVKNSATRVSQNCFKAFQRAARYVGRKMVEQQLKRLDASA